MMKVGYPHYRWVAVTAYLASWIPLIFGVKHHMKKRKKPNPFVHYKNYIIWGSLLLVTAYVLCVMFPVHGDNFFGVTTEEIETQIEEDIYLLHASMGGLDDALISIKEHEELFTKDVEDLTIEEKTMIRELWGVYVDHGLQLERLKETHSQFYQIDYFTKPELNARSFLIAYAAFIKNYNNALELHQLIGRNQFLKTLLNEEHKEAGVPKDGYLYLENAIVSPQTIVQLNAGRLNYRFLQITRQFTEQDRDLLDFVHQGFYDVYIKIGRKPSALSDAFFTSFEERTFTYWFPVQKEVAKDMGLVKISKRDYFIKGPQVAKANTKMEPGDIVLTRKNWFLSNAGLPGFWPHSALYTGNLDEMDHYFGKSEVLGGMLVSEYLETNHPMLYEKYSMYETENESGRIIEAVSEGISLHSLAYTLDSDYAAVIRPHLTKDEKLIALKKAFTYYGVPYDFDFDFVTDNKMVCSELLYKAYEPQEGYSGVSWDLTMTAGRFVVTPNNMVKNFDQTFGTNESQFEFVLFLDGLGGMNKAYFAEVEDFRETWKRSKWSIAQE